MNLTLNFNPRRAESPSAQSPGFQPRVEAGVKMRPERSQARVVSRERSLATFQAAIFGSPSPVAEAPGFVLTGFQPKAKPNAQNNPETYHAPNIPETRSPRRVAT